MKIIKNEVPFHTICMELVGCSLSSPQRVGYTNHITHLRNTERDLNSFQILDSYHDSIMLIPKKVLFYFMVISSNLIFSQFAGR